MMVLRTVVVFLIVSISTSLTALAQNPGMIVVLGETPETAVFRVPENSPYKFQYDPARITLWDSVDRQNAISSGAVFQTGVATPGCEVGLADYAAFQTCFSGDGGGVAPGCAGFDADVDDDIGLDDYGTFHGTFIGPVCNIVFVPVFVEGLTASTALGDVAITLLTDPDGDDKFAVEATQPVTVVSIDITPTSGSPGTALTIAMQPGIPPLAFDATTTAMWTGIYDPVVGAPSNPFSFIFSSDQVHEQSPTTAVLLTGDGTLIGSIPPLEQLASTEGSLAGEVAIVLASGQYDLRRSHVFNPTPQSRFLSLVCDPENPDDTPLFGSELGEIEIVLISDPLNPPFLPGIRVAHFALEVCVEDNEFTSVSPPPTLIVDIATTDVGGTVLDSIANLTLSISSETLPGCLLYRSDAGTPLIIVSEAIDDGIFPDMIVLRGAHDGVVAAVPGRSP